MRVYGFFAYGDYRVLSASQINRLDWNWFSPGDLQCSFLGECGFVAKFHDPCPVRKVIFIDYESQKTHVSIKCDTKHIDWEIGHFLFFILLPRKAFSVCFVHVGIVFLRQASECARCLLLLVFLRIKDLGQLMELWNTSLPNKGSQCFTQGFKHRKWFCVRVWKILNSASYIWFELQN